MITITKLATNGRVSADRLKLGPIAYWVPTATPRASWRLPSCRCDARDVALDNLILLSQTKRPHVNKAWGNKQALYYLLDTNPFINTMKNNMLWRKWKNNNTHAIGTLSWVASCSPPALPIAFPEVWCWLDASSETGHSNGILVCQTCICHTILCFQEGWYQPHEMWTIKKEKKYIKVKHILMTAHLV